MDINLVGSITAVAVIVGLVEALKSFGLDSKFAPVVALVLGLAASTGLAFYGDTKAFEAVVTGLAIGLSAIGLYSGTKNSVEGVRRNRPGE